MEYKKEDPDHIELSPESRHELWEDLILKFSLNKNKEILSVHRENPKIFWATFGKTFYLDFIEKTNFKKSQIRLNSSNIEKSTTNIKEQ
ncbi:MAG: hypothetical protein LCH67_08390 [Bacteroidetes bacterium]|nr:hypothetical protein [Bacteroidota bacterium]